MRGGGRGGGGIAPPALEVPLTIPGLKAWFDSRSTDYFALGGGGEVSAWLSRPEGSLGAIAWQQGTGSNQPIRVASEPLFNNMPAVLLDGVNDTMLTNNQNAWIFTTNGTGYSSFRVFRVDATGGTVLALFAGQSSPTHVGTSHFYQSTSLLVRVGNGTVYAATASFATAAHFARGVSMWQMIGHVTGDTHSRVSGSALTVPDINPVSTANPSVPARLGATVGGASQFFKGHLAQELYYDHVLTAGETTQLANWAASIYSVAA